MVKTFLNNKNKYGDITISVVTETSRFQYKNRHEADCNRLEMNPNIYRQIIFDKWTETKPREKDSLFNIGAGIIGLTCAEV